MKNGQKGTEMKERKKLGRPVIHTVERKMLPIRMTQGEMKAFYKKMPKDARERSVMILRALGIRPDLHK